MGRAKLNMELIPKEKSRNSTYLKRKKGLKKKIYEFTTLCGVDACMIIYGVEKSDRPIEPETWPNNLDETHRIINRYHQVAKEDRGKRSLHLVDFFQDRNRKMEDELVKLRRRNECYTWDDRVNSFTVDQLGQLMDTLGTKTDLMDERIVFLKGQDSFSDGVTGIVEYSHATQNHNPCYMPTRTGTTNNEVLHGTTWRRDDNILLNTQPLRHVAPLDYMMTMDNYPCSDHPSMMFDNATTPMMAMNGFDYYGNFGCGPPIGNFSHPTTVRNHPLLYDQSRMMLPPMQDMEFTNRGSSSTYHMQTMMMPTPSFLQQPGLMPMGTSSQIQYQPSPSSGLINMVGSSSSQMHQKPSNELFDIQDSMINKYNKRVRF